MPEQPFGRVRLIEMVVESVRVHMLSSQHVVILKESERDRYLPIWIGASEADAIRVAVRTGSPIYVDERVLDEAGVEPDASDGEDSPDDEKLAVFREFVNSLDVDLASGERGPP